MLRHHTGRLWSATRTALISERVRKPAQSRQRLRRLSTLQDKKAQSARRCRTHFLPTTAGETTYEGSQPKRRKPNVPKGPAPAVDLDPDQPWELHTRQPWADKEVAPAVLNEEQKEYLEKVGVTRQLSLVLQGHRESSGSPSTPSAVEGGASCLPSLAGFCAAQHLGCCEQSHHPAPSAWGEQCLTSCWHRRSQKRRQRRRRQRPAPDLRCELPASVGSEVACLQLHPPHCCGNAAVNRSCIH